MKAKRSLAILLALCMVGSYACANAKQVFSIDSSRILRESREGRQILASNEQDKKELMDLEYGESRKVAKFREELEKGMQAGKFTGNIIQMKYEELNRMQRRAKHSVEDAREDYKIKEQRRVIAFREKVHTAAGAYFKKQGGSMVFDRATPGIIFSAESIDRTDALLKELNNRHEQDKAKLAMIKGKNKKA